MTDQTNTPEFHGLTRRQPKLWLAMIEQAEQDNEEFDLNRAEIEEEISRGRSIVPVYKKREYRDRAIAAGHTTKRKKRSCNDWTAIQLQRLTLDGQDKIDLPTFRAVLDANGVKYAHLEGKGNPGTLRMSGGILLRSVLRRTGVLTFPDGSTKELPFEALQALGG